MDFHLQKCETNLSMIRPLNVALCLTPYLTIRVRYGRQYQFNTLLASFIHRRIPFYTRRNFRIPLIILIWLGPAFVTMQCNVGLAYSPLTPDPTRPGLDLLDSTHFDLLYSILPNSIRLYSTWPDLTQPSFISFSALFAYHSNPTQPNPTRLYLTRIDSNWIEPVHSNPIQSIPFHSNSI